MARLWQMAQITLCEKLIFENFVQHVPTQVCAMMAWQNDYLRGTGMEMYTETLSPSFCGMPFAQATRWTLLPIYAYLSFSLFLSWLRHSWFPRFGVNQCRLLIVLWSPFCFCWYACWVVIFSRQIRKRGRTTISKGQGVKCTLKRYLRRLLGWLFPKPASKSPIFGWRFFLVPFSIACGFYKTFTHFFVERCVLGGCLALPLISFWATAV